MFSPRMLSFLAAIGFALAALPCLAQEKKDAPKKPERIAIADPLKAMLESDFSAQGEYEGVVTDKSDKLGAQVIAKGDGKFDVKLFPGGLPGAGWDGKTPPELAIASRDKNFIVMTSPDGKQSLGSICQGSINYKNEGSKLSAELNQVERKSKTLGAKPPEGAVVLFGGPGDEKNWNNGKLVEMSDGKFLGVGVTSKQAFGAFKVHVEFRTPWMPNSRGQQRGNSGFYLQDRYEIQVLDSFGLKGENNECGGIYTLHKPIVNMCYPPLSWQTYDIEFTPAVFDAEGKKTKNARATVFHNGVKIHDDVEITKVTGGNGLPENAKPGPFQLQNHGDPAVFNNIWVVEMK